MTRITTIPVLRDNYAYLIEHEGVTAVVDPGEAAPVLAALKSGGLTAELILLTHHHNDHTAGAQALRDATGAPILAPAGDGHAMPYADTMLAEGGIVNVGGLEGIVLDTPGHTSGHAAFHFATARAVFTGDTLFSLGCGRVFEGTAPMMWESLRKLAALPPDTMVYCGHEYTEGNGIFALEADPDNADLLARMREVRGLRRAGKPTIPVSLASELATNPFLRAKTPEQFAKLRAWKDEF